MNNQVVYRRKMHCLKYGEIVIMLIIVATSLGINSISLIEIDHDSGHKIIPPTPKFQGTFAETHEHETIGRADTCNGSWKYHIILKGQKQKKISPSNF